MIFAGGIVTRYESGAMGEEASDLVRVRASITERAQAAMDVLDGKPL